MPVSFGRDELMTRFGEHEVTDAQSTRMHEVRMACFVLAEAIDRNCPGSREKSDAMTNLEYCMYQAVASIARRTNKAAA